MGMAWRRNQIQRTASMVAAFASFSANCSAGSISPASFSNPTPTPVAQPTSPRWKRPTVATSNRSWTSGATASPTPKRRMPEQIFDSQKL